MSAGIRGRSLRAAYGDHVVLDGVDLDVEPAAWVTVVGPNGAGKTTLLRVVAGLVDHGGALFVAGDPVGSLSRRERARRIALVPQSPEIPPGMIVTDYLLLGRTPHLSLFGTETAADLAAVAEILDVLDLTHLAGRTLNTLSGGERQRAVLGRALVQEAPVLLLDEPTTALDVGHQQEVLDLVDQLRRDRGLTVLATLHDLTAAGQYADRLVMLDHGRIVAEGAAADVLTPERIARHYHARVKVVTDDEGGVVVVPARPPPRSR
jgi:iron complex transport system ATP-binding protein